jgi:hypothetical protein
MVLSPQRRARPPPYTGKVLKERPDSWHHGLSPSSHQERLESLPNALKNLADTRLGVASVLANLQVWRRQVGFVQGTWWLVGSSAGRMVA